MLRFLAILLACFAAIDASPVTLAEFKPYAGTKVDGGYLITLKPNVARTKHLQWLKSQFGNTTTLTHTDWSLSNAFAGKFAQATIDKLRANPDVALIEEDGIMQTQTLITQTNAPWGIARLSQNGRLTQQLPTALNYTYRYDSAGGAGVDIYVVDTGINTAHVEFGGRARLGAVFGSSQNVDGHGHGTHCSGTAAGTRFGVAKSAILVAVKVLSDSGSGSVSNIVSGLNYVLNSARSSGRPTIATLSLGGSPSTSLDNGIQTLINNGIHCTIAAGNSNVNANTTSPARVAAAVTVGATTIADAKASFSNFGSIIDIWAPGQDITSAWIGSTTATNIISGTSMATPHVAGLIAYLISREGNRTPAAMITRLHQLGVDGVLTGIPSGTRNEIARNDIP